MSGMLALMRKDWRLNRVCMVALAVAVLGPYVLMCVLYVFANSEADRIHAPRQTLASFLTVAPNLGASLVALVAPALGGAAFAMERRERWADFLAIMPATRIKIIASKLFVSACCLTCAWLIHSEICTLLLPHAGPEWPALDQELMRYNMWCSQAIGWGAFGIALLLSTFLESAAIAASAAIALIFMVTTITAITANHARDPARYNAPIGDYVRIIETVLAVAAATIISASAYYARRIAP